MAKLRLFKSTMQYCQTSGPAGQLVVFRDHMFATADADVVEWLEKQVKSGHPVFYVDANRLEVDEDYLDPVAQLKKQLTAEIMASIRAGNLDVGNYGKQDSSGIASSKDAATSATKSSLAGLIAAQQKNADTETAPKQVV